MGWRLATTAAVLYALYRDNIARYYNRPVLRARIAQGPPDCLLSPISLKYGAERWEGKAYWLRLWIQNVGRDRAEQVQVFVSKLYQRGLQDKFTSASNSHPDELAVVKFSRLEQS